VALLGALTPLVKWPRKRLWIEAVFIYTAGGLASALAVGWLLGRTGTLLVHFKSVLVWIVPLGAVIFAARDAGWIFFPVPERKVQTESIWFHQFGPLQAAAMWGLHIGLGFFTRVTYMGFWVLVAALIITGDSSFGALVMGCYWLGRALPAWVAPVLTVHDDGKAGLRMMADATEQRVLFRRLHLAGLLCSALVGIFLALGGW
jgi:hypothetical protein